MVDVQLLERDLSGIVCIITGGHSGLGRSTTFQLLKQGATVVVGCRNIEDDRCSSLRLATEKLTGTIHFEVLDLSCCNSVRNFVHTFEQNYNDGLHILINNAGIMGVTPRCLSTDGFELQFQTNYLSHFLLTHLLIDRLKQSSTSEYTSRVINISSSNAVQDGLTGAHGFVDLDDINFNAREYTGMAGYGQSKLCQILHAKELATQHDSTELLAVSVHPGSALSNITRNLFPYAIRVLISPSERCLTGQISDWAAIQTGLHCILSDGLTAHRSDWAVIESGEFYSQHDSPLGTRGGWPLYDYIECAQAADSDIASKLYRRSLLWAQSTAKVPG